MTRELGGQLRDDWEDWVNWISWHILAYLGIMKVKPGASEQLGWVGPEVRVPTEWYTVRGTGLPINVTFLAWSTLLACFFSSCHFVVPNTNSDCTWLYIIRWLMMVVSCCVHLVKSPCRWLRILQLFQRPSSSFQSSWLSLIDRRSGEQRALKSIQINKLEDLAALKLIKEIKTRFWQLKRSEKVFVLHLTQHLSETFYSEDALLEPWDVQWACRGARTFQGWTRDCKAVESPVPWPDGFSRSCILQWHHPVFSCRLATCSPGTL